MDKEKKEEGQNGNSVFFLTSKGMVIRVRIVDIPLRSLRDNKGRMKSRKAFGVRVIKLKPGDDVRDISLYNPNSTP